MVYKEALINKTKCNNHDFCKVVVVDVVIEMMDDGDDENIRLTHCDIDVYGPNPQDHM